MNTLRYVIYARKSTEGKEKQVQSIERQLKELKAIAERENLNVVKVMEPEEKSAKAPYKRTIFYEMIKMIESGEANAILAWHMDRLTRNPTDYGMIAQLMDDGKLLEIQTAHSRHDSEANSILIDIEASIAKNFIKDHTRKVNSGMALKMANGGIPGPAPQGYKNNFEFKTIEVDDNRFHVVRSIFDLFLNGKTVPEIKVHLDNIGYTTPKRKSWGGIPISRSGVYSILSNIRYAGIVPNPYNPEDAGVAQYQRMISIAEFDEVQRLLGTRGRPRNVKAKDNLPYRGLIRCGECGCVITPSEKFKDRADGTRKAYIYYRCTLKRKCSQKKNIELANLQAQINELFNSYTIDDRLHEWGLRALEDIAQHELKNRSRITQIKYAKLESLEEQLKKLVLMNASGKISDEMYDDLSGPIENDLKIRKSELNEHEVSERNWFELVGNSLRELNVEKKVNYATDDYDRVIRAIGQNPLLKDGKLSITPFEWLEPVLKRIKIENTKKIGQN